MNNIRPDSGKPVWGKRSNGNKRIFMSREICVAVNIREFGKENKETILLIHPSVVKWDYFENAIPLLQENYHLLVPALPGYDFENDSDFTSVEQIAFELNVWMKAEGYTELYAVYGCSMGGLHCVDGSAETNDRNKALHRISYRGSQPVLLP